MSDSFNKAIHPSSYVEDVGRLQLLVHKSLDLLQETWLQSPHWTSEPTTEMLVQEAHYERRMVEAQEEVKDVAAEIYLALTGVKLPREFHGSH